jgi:hypothetical protein
MISSTALLLRSSQPTCNLHTNLLGLPAELRLEIYHHLFGTNLVHVGYTGSHRDGFDKWSLSLTRRPCRCPDTNHPQLCANPIYSGFCQLHEYCDDDIPAMARAHSITQICRLIRQETRGMNDFQYSTCFSMPIGNASLFLRYVTFNGPFLPLTSLTMTPSYGGYYFKIPHMGHTDTEIRLHDAIRFLCKGAEALPNLQSVTISTRQPISKLRTGGKGFTPEEKWKEFWYVKQLRRRFEGRITITVEMWMMVRYFFKECKSGKDEMIRIRGVVHKRKKGDPRGQERTDFEIHQAEVMKGELTSGWKTYWRGRFMGYGRPTWSSKCQSTYTDGGFFGAVR